MAETASPATAHAPHAGALLPTASNAAALSSSKEALVPKTALASSPTVSMVDNALTAVLTVAFWSQTVPARLAAVTVPLVMSLL
jgi:hypothetical protein